MSADDAALREMAANRGCRLVKSRVRTEGRGDYGKFGLKDASGKEVFGFGKRGLTATQEEIEQFLRGGAAATWKSSVGATPARRKQAVKRPEPKPKPEPALVVREAKPGDAAALTKLITDLGYEASEADVRKRLAALGKAERPALVADRGGTLGCLTWHVTPVLHRPKPVGRITMMVVAGTARGKGVGRALVEAAAERLRAEGCGLIEVTSNIKRLHAHGFYERLGFERTSYRFAKPLDAS